MKGLYKIRLCCDVKTKYLSLTCVISRSEKGGEGEECRHEEDNVDKERTKANLYQC